MAAGLEQALARHRAVCLGALAVLALGAWGWLLAGAGMGTMPPAGAMPMGAMAAEPPFALVLAMWWVMMVAMMLPSAAPTILLYARAASGRSGRFAPASGSFLAGYLLVWGGFSLAAAWLQLDLERTGLVSPMTMALHGRVAAGGVLVVTGLYQASPIKDACLRECQSPARFLSQYFRPGRLGALRMGLLHGAFCVGCCWLLMALLFVGGVMNIAWIALLTLLVAAEKLLPIGRRLSLASGAALVLWGLALLVSRA